MQTYRPSLAISILTALTICTAPSLTAAPALDGCGAELPRVLARRLEAKYPKNRLPLASDSKSSCVNDRAPRHGSMCLLVVAGDFDGDGLRDFAVLLPAKKERQPAKLVVALQARGDWKLEEVPIGLHTVVGHLGLSSLPPRDYKETPAAMGRGQAQRVIRLDHDGLALYACDSWMSGYFRMARKWKAFTLSD
jgi:hypothetical protein